MHFILLFQLENDAENWHFFKLFGKNVVLKKNIVPHRDVKEKLNIKHEDSCSQLTDSDKKRKLENIEEFATTARSKRRLLEEADESCQPELQLPQEYCTEELETTMKDCAIQVNLRKSFRSIGVVAKPNTATTSTSPIQKSVESASTNPAFTVESSSDFMPSSSGASGQNKIIVSEITSRKS